MAEPTQATREFGERVHRLRVEQRLSQRELGERVGVKYRTVMRYEQGVSHPTLDVIRAFADALGVTEADLAGREKAA